MEKYYNNGQSSSSSSSRTLEISVLSGEDLRINKRPISKHAYVILRSNGSGEISTTALDLEGGSNPKWENQRFLLETRDCKNSPPLTIEVRCKTAFGDKIVGTSSIPASDFSGGYVPENYLHFLSYRLRDSRGERNGIVNISVRTKYSSSGSEEKRDYQPYTCRSVEMRSSEATVGLAVGNLSGGGGGGGVVTGVPVLWSSYQRNY